MAKKLKSSKHKKRVSASVSPVDKYIDLIERDMLQGNYSEAVVNCERLLNYLPQRASQRVRVLAHLGTAYGMLQNFSQAYDALSEALALDPKNAELWYNRSTTGRFMMRLGQALWDLERAIELNTRSDMVEKFAKDLPFSREMADKSMKLRGPDFTLEQLIEQENLFQQGLKLMEAEKWEEAGLAFQASIDLGDCLPQPWGNLGITFMMQERYDEAEAALKRAIAMDPSYTIAKTNLAALPEFRRTGPPGGVALNEPFKHAKLKQSITFIRE